MSHTSEIRIDFSMRCSRSIRNLKMLTEHYPRIEQKLMLHYSRNVDSSGTLLKMKLALVVLPFTNFHDFLNVGEQEMHVGLAECVE